MNTIKDLAIVRFGIGEGRDYFRGDVENPVLIQIGGIGFCLQYLGTVPYDPENEGVYALEQLAQGWTEEDGFVLATIPQMIQFGWLPEGLDEEESFSPRGRQIIYTQAQDDGMACYWLHPYNE
jgi:hypothetical protein